MIERCPTCHQKRRRSNPANARYWLLLHAIADKVCPQEQQYSAETWHCYFKSKYLGCNDIKMPNGKTIVVPNSSAELDTEGFATYMMRVEAWAQERNVFLDELPD